MSRINTRASPWNPRALFLASQLALRGDIGK